MICYVLLVLSICNFLFNLICYKSIISKFNLLEKTETKINAGQQADDIHNILSSRLLDIQNRRYSLIKRKM